MKYLLLTAALLGLAVLIPPSSSTSSDHHHKGKVVVCYFGSWSTYRWGKGLFDVESIDPFLCTHLIYGFAGLDPQTHLIKSLDPYNDLQEDWGKGAFNKFTELKLKNPQLKTLLAIGGWNEGSTTYSNMAKSESSRKTFIDSVITMLKKHNFDGLDLDWEYPGGREDSPGHPQDKENFSKLLREMRVEFNKHKLLMTAAVSAGFHTIDAAYEVETLSQTLDLISIMSYDYHGWWKDHAFTGHNSPLYARPEEKQPESPGYGLNTDFSVKYWLSKGAKKSQLTVGMGAYGRGFRLQDPANNGLFAPASGPIDAALYTSTHGFWGFNELCEKMQTEKDQWTVVRDENVVAPYMYKRDLWFSYDDVQSIEIKSKYVLDNQLAGAMVWSIDTDDFHGLCGGEKFPLISAINRVFKRIHPHRSPGKYQPDDLPKCDGHYMIVADPDDCTAFYFCTQTAAGTWQWGHDSCDEGMAFNPDINVCDLMENVPECLDEQSNNI